MSKKPAALDPLETPTAPGTPDDLGTPFDPATHAHYKSGRGMVKFVTEGGRRLRSWFNNGKKAAARTIAPAKAADLLPRDPVESLRQDKPAPTPSAAPDPLAAVTSWPTVDKIPTADATPPTEQPANADPLPEDAPPPPPVGRAEATAATVAGLVEAVGVMALGPDMLHTGDERAAVREAWRAYLATRPDFDLPPGAALCVVYAGLVAQRFDKPTFRERCALWGARFKKWFGGAR